MKTFAQFIVYLCIVLNTFVSWNPVHSQNWDWVTLLNSTSNRGGVLGGVGSVSQMVTDDLGNLYVYGAFRDSLHMDTISLGSPFPNSADLFLAKFNSSGRILWAFPMSGSSGDSPTALFLIDNHLFITGLYTRAFSIGSIQLPGSLIGPRTFIAKLDLEGQVKWAKPILAKEIFIHAIDSDENGDLAIAGTAYSQFFPDGLSYKWPIAGGAFLAKADSNGVFQWISRIDSSGYQGGEHVSFDSQGGIYLGGNVFAPIAFGNNDTAISKLTGKGAFISHFDTNGKFNWARVYRGELNGPSIEMEGMYVDSMDNLFWLGGIRSNGFIDTFNTSLLNSSGALIKSDSRGKTLWVKSTETRGIIKNFSSNNDNKLLILGWHSDSSVIGGQLIIKAGLFAVQMDTSGVIDWAESVEVPISNAVYDASCSSPDGAWYVAGLFGLSLDFGGTVLSPRGNFLDTFMGRISGPGNPNSIFKLKKISPSFTVKVLPNPNGGNFKIRLESLDQKPIRGKLRLWNIQGISIWSENLYIPTLTYEKDLILNKVPAGIYFLGLDQQILQKIIIN